MRKLCLIVPYFGKLPNYFQLFLNSCAANPDFNWLIFTDDKTPFEYPGNVNRVLTSFDDIKKLFASKFDFKLALDKPYKFCDFKPSYGYVFEDYLKDFRFWGHCDIDTIMGNLSEFLTDDFLSRYDKIFALGHMTLYKNTPENNRVFMKEYGGASYKEYFSSSTNFAFDEDTKYDFNIHNLFKSVGKKVFEGDFSLNFDLSKLLFTRVRYVGLSSYPLTYGHVKEQTKKALYLWKNGEICRYFLDKDNIVEEKYMYTHLQMRKMYLMPNVQDAKNIRISPNVFSVFDDDISKRYLQIFNPLVKYPDLNEVILFYLWNKIRRYIGKVVRSVIKQKQ